MAVPLKHLSNFLSTLEIPFIDFEICAILTCSVNSIIAYFIGGIASSTFQ